jgi:hypothetical protein
VQGSSTNSAELGASPLELSLEPGKRLCREDQGKARLGIGNLLNHAVDDRIGARHEWFLPKPHCWVIEDPHAFRLVRVNRD